MDTGHLILPAGDKPKYVRLAEALTQNFIAGAKPHSALPTERDLQQSFAVSRDTVRRAISHLIDKGLLYNVQGSGTFVADRKNTSKTPRLVSFTEDMQARGLRPASRTISCSLVPASAGVARDLDIPAGQNVLKIFRIRTADGAPIAIENAYFLPESFAHVEPHASSSLDMQLADNGYRIMNATMTVSATTLTKDEASALQLPTGSPALRVHRVGYTVRGVAVESTDAMYRADSYDFEFSVERES